GPVADLLRLADDGNLGRRIARPGGVAVSRHVEGRAAVEADHVVDLPSGSNAVDQAIPRSPSLASATRQVPDTGVGTIVLTIVAGQRAIHTQVSKRLNMRCAGAGIHQVDGLAERVVDVEHQTVAETPLNRGLKRIVVTGAQGLQEGGRGGPAPLLKERL